MSVQALKEKMNGLTTEKKPTRPHPLNSLRAGEIDIACRVVREARTGCLLLFRDIFLEEPVKATLVPFLDAEHSGHLTEDTPRPPRLARVQYDTIGEKGSHEYTESVVDVDKHAEVLHRVVEKEFQPPLTVSVDRTC